MRNLLQLIIRYHFFILFLLLEVLSSFFVFRYNHFQRASFNSFATALEGFVFDRLGGLRNYMDLRTINQNLSRENNILLNEIDRLGRNSPSPDQQPAEPEGSRQWLYKPARVINNSVNKPFNYITADKGSMHGIRPEMAVISSEGVVGIVFSVSRHFSTVLPVLNQNFRLSSKLEKNNYFGSLQWTGPGTDEAQLLDIPGHVDVSVGDTVVTSGYSAIFPDGILVGTVSRVSAEEQSFHTIGVKLSVDFRKLSYVNIIENLLLEEQQNLENPGSDD
jgi:rod shape-determining protein MreC